VKLWEVGAGTERVETLLRELFPAARILRADTDAVKSQEEMHTILKAMREGNADILLGTQMVVKGLDLPNVTLASVLLADVGLSLPHFRAGERIFQLLTQLTGRAGGKREVIIQTFRPQALEIALAAKQDVKTYLEQELATRMEAHYPPETEMVRVLFSGPRAAERSFQYTNILKGAKDIHVSRSPSLFSEGEVWQVLLRGQNVRTILKNTPKFDGIVDVDPVECL